MKILFFIGKLYGGGAERVAVNLLNHLSEHHEVIAAIANDNHKVYPLKPGITIKIIDFRWTNRFYQIFSNTLVIKNILKEIKPDLIISFIVDLNGCVLLANSIYKRKRIIVSERTTIQRKQSVWQIITRRILYKLAQVVFVSKSDFSHAKWLKNKTFIYNPLSYDTITNKSCREKTVVAIGPQSRWHVKGFDMLILAWAKIVPLHPDWKLQFIGANNDSLIRDLTKDFGLEKQVEFLGWTDEIDKILRSKSIYVLSSRNEGFPNSLIEAMSQGCACVAFDCKTAPNEIITDGVSGILARNGDIDDLTTKVRLLIEDEQLRRRLASAATEEVRKFEKDKIMRLWDELIQSTVEP